MGQVGKFLTILDIFEKMAIFLGVKIKLRLSKINVLITENIFYIWALYRGAMS